MHKTAKCTKPIDFTGTQTQEGKVYLTWSRPLNMHRDVIFKVFYASESIGCAHSSKDNKVNKKTKLYTILQHRYRTLRAL